MEATQFTKEVVFNNLRNHYAFLIPVGESSFHSLPQMRSEVTLSFKEHRGRWQEFTFMLIRYIRAAAMRLEFGEITDGF